jgi:hypothetical protein
MRSSLTPGRALRAGKGTAKSTVAVLTAVLAVLVWCTSASAAKYVSSFGSFSNVQGVAVDDSTGDVYVYDTGAGGEILKFDASGAAANFTATGTNAIGGVGTPPFGGPGESEIAVDNSSGPNTGDVYLAFGATHVAIYDPTGSEIGELTEAPGESWGEACGVAVDTSGNVYVGIYGSGSSGHVYKYVPSSGAVTNTDYASAIGGVTEPCNVAADSAGNVFTVAYNQGPVTRYEPSQFGSLSASGSVVDKAGSTLAVDPATDEVYVDETSQIARFGPHGEPFQAPTSTFGSSGPGAIAGSYGIAVSDFDQSLYVSDGSGQVSIFSTALLAPDVNATGISNLQTEGSVTLNGSVNPKGFEVQSCQFEYGPTEEYGSVAQCASSPGSGSAPVAVSAEVSGLNPGSAYHYRLVAANAEGENASKDQTFIAPTAPTISNDSVSAVTSDSATFTAEINPGGVETAFHVEYGPTESYGSSAPVSGGYVGSDLKDTMVTVHPEDLQVGTTYHFRFAASNVVGARYGPDHTFTTQTAGQEFSLPDGRAYEMVSPPQKSGAQVMQPTAGGGIVEAAETGDGLAYIANSAIGSEPPSNPWDTQMLARRGQGEWTNTDISVPEEYGTRVGQGLGDMLFSPDLSLTVAEPHSLVSPLSPEAPTSLERDLYLHDTSSTVYRPLVTSAPAAPKSSEKAELAGATPDLSHIVFNSNLALTPPAREATRSPNLYEWAAGNLSLVNILPSGVATAGEASLGGSFGNNTRHAIADSGARVVWSSQGAGSTALYMRDMIREETIQVDAAQGGTESGGGVFQTASSDTSTIFFTDSKSLTGDAFRTDLYVFETDSGKLANITPDESDPEGADVRSVIGASKNGEEAYFVAGGTLAPGAVVGANNLYLTRHVGARWETSLIATLSEDDRRGFDQTRTNGDLVGVSARVSSDGRFLAFMSDAALTPYDNRDANSDRPDEEVYLYDSAAPKLTCVSCNPTGARPVGELDSREAPFPLMDPVGAWGGRWLAATVPSWTPMTLQISPYQPRYLSDSGRLFFNSADALVSQDSNGRSDAYEYEPNGVGTCAKQAGCVALISRGSGNSDAAFLDASSSGDDVFLLTRDRLLRQDFDTSFDIYDARVCTGTHPCFPEQAASPPPCTTGDSCKPAPSPPPAAFGAPASATFAGEGNLKPATTVAAKHKKTAKKPAKKHRRKHKHKRRHGHRRKRHVKGRKSQVRVHAHEVAR